MKKLIISSFLLFGVMALHAQVKKVVADKIIAQVGDKIILQSDIDNVILDAKRQNTAYVPTRCEVVESELVQKALLLQAQKDSLTVSDEEVDAKIDNRIRSFINMYGSQQVLEEIAGRSVYQLKEDFRKTFKEGSLADQMRGKILENIKITPVEVRAYFDKIPKDSLPFYESEMELSQIVAYPKPNREVEEYVTKQLYDWKRQVEAGTKKFEELVRLYTDDPGSRETGGQYTLNRNDKGVWDPAFLAAAFRLKEGQVSNVVKSKFGLHIIQMVSRSGDDAVVRHILRIPPVTEGEINDAKTKLDSIRAKIVAGTLTFGEAIKFSEDDNAKFNAGAISAPDGSSFVTIDQLDKDLVEKTLKTLKIGEVSAPQLYTDERGRKVVRLVYLRSKTEPHRENLKDDYDKVSKRALEEKKQAAMHKWFAEHLPSYYINVDSDFSACTNITEWLSAAAKNNK
ncbi:MAG: peptidylprolyl isomerase [Filimonas sp.]|nr:peptidylprolyl isomerase [Filimonas sp.]